MNFLSPAHRHSFLPRFSGAKLGAAVVAIFSLLFSASCWQRETNVHRGNAEQILHRGIGPEIPDLDPQLAVGASDYNVLIALFEGLVTEDPVDLHPVPGVAEKWEPSPDGLRYTFHLRENAKWSNGEPVTAQDFVRSYERMLSPSLAADNAYMLYVFQNAEAFHKGTLKDFAEVGVHAIDSHTLRLTLEHPAPYLLPMLTQMAFMPVHLPTIEKFGPAAQRGNAWARPGRMVSNGAFQLTEWKTGQKIVVTKSPTYWDAATVKLTEIDFYPYESRDAEERAFRAGQLHLTEALPSGKVETYRRNEPALLRIDPYLATEFYRINITRPFLNDRRVRRAMSLAIDRKALAENILRGGQKPAFSLTPPNTAGYTATAGTEYNPKAARALLAEAGYPGGKGAPAIEVLINQLESHRAVGEAVQEMWRKELGLQVKLVAQENKMLLTARTAGDYQVLRSIWSGDFIDPLSFLGIFTSTSGNNYTSWANRTYDQLVFEAARVAEPSARNTLLAKAEALLLDEAPIIPLYHYTHVFVIQPSVKNWHPTLLDHHPYKYVYLQAP
ncbi:MAG TPA: peptide ABC transporter substrate-binding protein [Opitutaceae bacterium]|nr:peptide ABC transporter substrate-binding protein [Opitutaceae bacterium]